MKHKILNIEVAGKWVELWLEGLPFEKNTRWDEETQTSLITDEDHWNNTSKFYLLGKVFKEGDFDAFVFEHGYKGLIGFILEIDDKGDYLSLSKAPANEQPKEYTDFIKGAIYNHQCNLTRSGKFEVTKVEAYWREDLQYFLGKVYYIGLTGELKGRQSSFQIGSPFGRDCKLITPAPSLAPVVESVEERVVTAKQIIDEEALKLFPETYFGVISDCIVTAMERYANIRVDECLKEHVRLDDVVKKEDLEFILNMSDEIGRAGCTYGDTDFDSLSACYGSNETLHYIQDKIRNLYK